jgi:membrane protein
VYQVLTESVVHFFQEDSLGVAASIAYYCLLGFFPFVLLLLGSAGIYIGRYELSGALTIFLERYLPFKPDVILRNLVSISRAYGRVGLVSFVLLLWASSGVFMPLEKALNRAWEVEEQRSWWRQRLLALEMALIFGFVVMFSLGSVVLSVYLHRRFGSWLSPGAWSPFNLAYHAAVILASFGLTMGLFVVLFERLPNRSLKIREVLPAALFTAILWEVTRNLFVLVMRRVNYSHIYGSIAAVIALMTWAYISSAVMLFGAQISRALYRTLKVSAPATAAAPIEPAAEPQAR